MRLLLHYNRGSEDAVSFSFQIGHGRSLKTCGAQFYKPQLEDRLAQWLHVTSWADMEVFYIRLCGQNVPSLSFILYGVGRPSRNPQYNPFLTPTNARLPSPVPKNLTPPTRS